MTPEERAAVVDILEGEVSDDVSGAIARLTTAEQLHQFALNYNPNDGVRPCLAVVEHRLCDEGTALYVYWLFADLLFDPALRAEARGKSPDWNCDAVLAAIERRVGARSFASALHAFDAATEFGLDAEHLRRLAANGVGRAFFHLDGPIALAREYLP